MFSTTSHMMEKGRRLDLGACIQCLLLVNLFYSVQYLHIPLPPFLSSTSRFRVHVVPWLPPASLTPEQPPTEPLAQGKIKTKVCYQRCIVFTLEETYSKNILCYFGVARITNSTRICVREELLGRCFETVLYNNLSF